MSRSRLALDVHEAVFARVLELLAGHGLVKGGRIGVDTPRQWVDAVLRAIVRRDSGDGCREMPERLAPCELWGPATHKGQAETRRRRSGSHGAAAHSDDSGTAALSLWFLRHFFQTVLDALFGSMHELGSRDNLQKRYLIQVSGYNLALIMRLLTGFGTPRRWADTKIGVLWLRYPIDGETDAVFGCSLFIDGSSQGKIITTERTLLTR